MGLRICLQTSCSGDLGVNKVKGRSDGVKRGMEKIVVVGRE